MHPFWGIVRCEYRMSVRRWGMWLAFALLFLPYLPAMLSYVLDPEPVVVPGSMWAAAAETVFQLNVLMPVVAGIAIADRLVRDQRLRVDELLSCTPVGRRTYILGKYVGALLSALTPVLVAMLVVSMFEVVMGASAGLPAQFLLIPVSAVAFVAIIVPAYAFITAFSLACPLVMPLRVYQILFTGYWFWGNFLSPRVMPTLNGTLLTPSGRFAVQGFFGGDISMPLGQSPYTATEAALNLLVLALCIVAALGVLDRTLAWRARQA